MLDAAQRYMRDTAGEVAQDPAGGQQRMVLAAAAMRPAVLELGMLVQNDSRESLAAIGAVLGRVDRGTLETLAAMLLFDQFVQKSPPGPSGL